MKTAIYIEQGVTQLVLTPENDWEKSALANFAKESDSFQIYRGSFYKCNGGWTRYDQTDDTSLMLRLTPKASPEGGSHLPEVPHA